MSRSVRTWSLIAKQWQVYHYKGSNNQQHEAACFSTLQLSCLQWENSVWLRLQWPKCSLVACPLNQRLLFPQITYICRLFTLGLHSTKIVQSIHTKGKTKSLSDWPFGCVLSLRFLDQRHTNFPSQMTNVSMNPKLGAVEHKKMTYSAAVTARWVQQTQASDESSCVP